jgi:hypothetical protein
MEPIVEQLQRLRQRKHEAAVRQYSQIINRYDQPLDGDAEALDLVMHELHLDLPHLQSDLRVVQQYRAYLKNEPGTHGCKKDAEKIRCGNKHLFIAIDDRECPPTS